MPTPFRQTLCSLISHILCISKLEFEPLLRHALWVGKDSNTFSFTNDVVVQYSVFLGLVIISSVVSKVKLRDIE